MILALPRDIAAMPSLLRKGPYVQDVTPTSATVRLELAAPAAATVTVATDGDDAGAKRVATGEAAAFHVLPITGLEPYRRYRYTVTVSGITETGFFTTAPAPGPGPGTPFRFVLYGDNRTDDVAHTMVARAVLGAKGDFLLHTGDYVQHGGNAEDWQAFFDIERPVLRERPIFGCIGNHELMDGMGAYYLRYFGSAEQKAQAATLVSTLESAQKQGGRAAPPGRARFFSTFRWGMARFFLLNAFDAWVESEERAWLENELARSEGEEGVKYRFAVLHHGPYSAGPHGPNVRMQNARIPEVLARHKVDVVFSGHDHIYERGQAGPLKYVVSGGGGAPLYRELRPLASTRRVEAAYHFAELEVAEKGVRMDVKRADGTLLESCGFAAGETTWDCDPKPVAAPAAPPSPSPAPPPSRCTCKAAGAESSGATPAIALVTVALTGFGARRARRPNERA